MSASHLKFLVEEPSMEAFLRELLPRLLPESCGFEVHSFQGKTDLIGNLQARLRGFAKWLPDDWRIVVVVDRDDDNCMELKQHLETMAVAAGLRTRTIVGNARWQIVNRVAIEELEAWYFGDWQAVCSAFPKVSSSISKQASYRDPDAIKGGTWEAFERVLQKRGYFKGGLRKVEAARAIGKHMNPDRSRSQSFKKFHAAIVDAVS